MPSFASSEKFTSDRPPFFRNAEIQGMLLWEYVFFAPTV